jgi:DNA-binding beta-propeller fold protein YncE
LPLEPLDAAGTMSAGAIALARVAGRTLSFIADADDRALVTFDVDTRVKLASTSLGMRPSAVLVTRAGRVAVLGADDAHVHLMMLVAVDAALVEERSIEVPAEPVAAALVANDDALLVASRWGHALSIVPLSASGHPVSIDLPRDPSAVVASADGKRAIVMHAAGSNASVVELATHTVTTGSLDRRVQRPVFNEMLMMPRPSASDLAGFENANPAPSQTSVPMPVARKPQVETVNLRADQTFALVRASDGRFMAPEVFVETGPAAPSGGYGGSHGTVTPAVVSFAGDDGRRLDSGGDRTFGSPCLLPRGAALDEIGKRMLVACIGSSAVAVLGVDAKGVKVARMVQVAKGPEAIAVDAEGRRAVVWSTFERTLSVIDLKGAPKRIATASVERAAPAPGEDVMRGQALFHASFDERVSSDGRACANCHPDGRDDGLTWSSPNGPMQTPMLLGRLEGTAPYGWDGTAKDLTHHLAHTTSRLGGAGLSKRDVTDIAAYLASLKAPVTTPADPTLATRGADLFHAEAVGCSGCHAGDALTDGDTHDVESGRPGRGGSFDTPSLRYIARSAPYFHDGRYATLGEMLTGTDGAMGHTSQLSPDERTALQAYLETL